MRKGNAGGQDTGDRLYSQTGLSYGDFTVDWNLSLILAGWPARFLCVDGGGRCSGETDEGGMCGKGERDGLGPGLKTVLRGQAFISRTP